MTRGLDPQRRGRIVALQSATGSLGGSIGYAVGGLVVQYTGWRTLFWAPLPVLTCIWLASLFLLPPDDAVKTPRGDTNGRSPRMETVRFTPCHAAYSKPTSSPYIGELNTRIGLRAAIFRRPRVRNSQSLMWQVPSCLRCFWASCCWV
jgi:MFS family permease